jgi:transposase
VARLAGAVRQLERGSHAVQPLGEERRLGECFQGFSCGCRQRIRDARFHYRPRTPARSRRIKKNGQETKDVRKQEAIGRSKGGLTTKIHALVDALGNPIDFILTPGQACDLEGADAFLPGLSAQAFLADKAYDADERVIKPLQEKGITIVIPPKANRKNKRAYDEDLYKARHLIENFFAKLKQFRAIATRYDKTARNFLAAVFLAGAYVWLN